MASVTSALTFFISSVLAVAGVLTALFGIFGDFEDGWKFVLTGFVLLVGAGVFATLYLGARRRRAG